MDVIRHDDGKVELPVTLELSASPLFNHDLAPVPVADRNWTTYNFSALWMSMSANISSYMLASGLIAAGMVWWQALMTIFLGNVIVLLPILLNSHPGTKYGIPFPVFARAAYGTAGSNLAALMRALVGCGWFGIQAWIGGMALNSLFSAVIPNWATLLGSPVGGYPPTTWVSFMLFWFLNILVVYRGMDVLRKLANLAAPFVFIMTIALTIWAVSNADGLEKVLNQHGRMTTTDEFMHIFIPSLSAVIGCWATLSLNMPDFTRFGRSQKEQMIGQMATLPLAMTLYSGMGVFITSAAVLIFPDAPMSELWDPIKLVTRFDNTLVLAVSMFTICLATLCVNIAANVVSPANDFANAFPRLVTFKRGAIITGVIGIIMQPWRLLSDASSYIFEWLQGYSGGLGSIAGVLVVDYWLIRNKELNLPDLYSTTGEYRYAKGWNPNAVIATIAGCVGAWIGLLVEPLKFLYEYAWFVGFGLSAVTYYVLMKSTTKSTDTPEKAQEA